MKLKKILALVILISAIWLIKIGAAEASAKSTEEMPREGTLIEITQLNGTKPMASSNGIYIVLHLLLTIKTTEESISLTWTSEHNGCMVNRDSKMDAIPIEFKEETHLLWGNPGKWLTGEELNGRTWYLAGKREINIEIIGRVRISPINSPGTYFETITFTVIPAL